MEHRVARRRQAVYCLAAAAAVLAVCSKSSPLYPLNDWMDANIFYTAGKAMMNGAVLYRDVFDHKGPLLYLVYGVGWLIDHTGFFGVWLIEIAAFAGFLYAGLRAVQAVAGPVHPAWVLLPGAAVAAGATFAHGGSAEELCLPLLAAPVWAALRFFAPPPGQRQPLSLGLVALLGAAAGCVLWVKFTMMGLFAGFALALAAGYLRAGWGKRLLQSIAAWLGGMAATLLPWLAYFGANGALADFFGTYFGANLFLYGGRTTGFAPAAAAMAVVQRLWWALHDAPLPMLLAAAGAVWLLVRRQPGCAGAVACMAGCLAVTAFAFGDYHIYYALPLLVFAPLGIGPAAALVRRLPRLPAPARPAAVTAAAAAAVAFCLLTCRNAGQLLRPAGGAAAVPVRGDPTAGGRRTAAQLRHAGRRFLHSHRPAAALQIFLRHQSAAASATTAAGCPACRRRRRVGSHPGRCTERAFPLLSVQGAGRVRRRRRPGGVVPLPPQHRRLTPGHGCTFCVDMLE